MVLRFKCIYTGICCKASPITLQSFEATIIRSLSRAFNIEIHTKPGYIVWDKIGNHYLAISYILGLNKDRRCPFLRKDNRCIIHDIYKPLICRSYPYVPREVRYLFIERLKLIVPKVEYGLSAKCPVIEKHKYLIDKYMDIDPYFVSKYMPNEYRAALEAESKRTIILNLLSSLWRRGLIDLTTINEIPSNVRIINVYNFLQKYYPNLPYVLGIEEIFRRIKEL